jgi:hypothetical protein
VEVGYHDESLHFPEMTGREGSKNIFLLQKVILMQTAKKKLFTETNAILNHSTLISHFYQGKSDYCHQES